MPYKCTSISYFHCNGAGAAALRVPRQGRRDTQKEEAERGSRGATAECGGRGYAARGGLSQRHRSDGRELLSHRVPPRPGRPRFEALAPDICCCWSCPTLYNPMDCSPPGSSVHGILPGKSTGVSYRAFPQGIFPTQGSNSYPLHCRWVVLLLSHQGSPIESQEVPKSAQRERSFIWECHHFIFFPERYFPGHRCLNRTWKTSVLLLSASMVADETAKVIWIIFPLQIIRYFSFCFHELILCL